MALYCRFTDCQWHGAQDEIFEHFELQHKKYLREPNGRFYYDFAFEDLQQEVFVLCSPNALYYMRQNINLPCNNNIDFGVFHIGESEQVTYTLKLGLKRDGHCMYWGPLKSRQDESENLRADDFSLSFDFDFIVRLNGTVPSRRLRLYFGEFDDSDDKILLRPGDIIWNLENECLNNFLVEHFTCGVCFKFIRRDARFCENHHFICLDCFEKVQKLKRLKCPTCRGRFLYDSADDELERLLCAIKWPDKPEIYEMN